MERRLEEPNEIIISHHFVRVSERLRRGDRAYLVTQNLVMMQPVARHTPVHDAAEMRDGHRSYKMQIRERKDG